MQYFKLSYHLYTKQPWFDSFLHGLSESITCLNGNGWESGAAYESKLPNSPSRGHPQFCALPFLRCHPLILMTGQYGEQTYEQLYDNASTKREVQQDLVSAKYPFAVAKSLFNFEIMLLSASSLTLRPGHVTENTRKPCLAEISSLLHSTWQSCCPFTAASYCQN